MYLIDDDKHFEDAQLEVLTFTTEHLCSECPSTEPTFFDRETGQHLCLECLETAVDDAAEEDVAAANAEAADFWQAERAQQNRDVARTALPCGLCADAGRDDDPFADF